MMPPRRRPSAAPSTTSDTASLQTPPGTAAPSPSTSSTSPASPDPSPDPQTPTPSANRNQSATTAGSAAAGSAAAGSAAAGSAAAGSAAADAPPEPYTSTDPITLESATFNASEPTAIVLKVKTQVRFYYKERPDQKKKATTSDPQEAMFRPVVPSNITFKFNVGPQKTLDDFKGLVMEAIEPALGGAATRAQPPEPAQPTEQSGDAAPSPATPTARSPASPPQPRWTVTPPSLVNLDTFFALYNTSQKRFYFLWGVEPEVHQNNHVKLMADNLKTLAGANEALLLVIFRYGFALSEKADFNDFYKEVLSAKKKGRGGFPDQVAHNDIVSRLQELWGGRYDAFAADWQRWATELVRIPVHELDAAMRRGPPHALISAFTPKQTEVQQQVQVIHEQSAISHTFIKQIEPRISRLAGMVKDLAVQFDHVQRELNGLLQAVADHKEVAAAYRVSSAPKEKTRRSRSAAVDAGLSDASDQDHAASSDSGSGDEGLDEGLEPAGGADAPAEAA